MRRALLAASVLCGALTGCADNAILELTIDLPAERACASRARLEARFSSPDEARCPEDVDWNRDAEDVVLGATPTLTLVDVVAEGADVDADLCVRVRWCERDCDRHDLAVDPSETVRLARPFLRGNRTTAVLRPAPPCE